MGAFVELQAAGKVRHIGVSNVSLDQLAIARSLCEVVSVQNRYNAGSRDAEAVLAECEKSGIAFLPWAPILVANPRAEAVVAAIAEDCGATRRQVALQWLLHRSPAILPIPGTSQLAHLDENVDAAWLDLGADELARIDAEYA